MWTAVFSNCMHLYGFTKIIQNWRFKKFMHLYGFTEIKKIPMLF